MKLKDVQQIVIDALCYHEAFIRLGFKADDIFVGHEEAIVFVVLKTQNNEFIVKLGVLALTEAQFAQVWNDVSNAYNSGAFDTTELQAAFLRTFPAKEAQNFLAAIRAKGISIPTNLN